MTIHMKDRQALHHQIRNGGREGEFAQTSQTSALSLCRVSKIVATLQHFLKLYRLSPLHDLPGGGDLGVRPLHPHQHHPQQRQPRDRGQVQVRGQRRAAQVMRMT